MEIEFYGGNCFRLKTKESLIVIDDNLVSLGSKSIVKKDSNTTVMFTNKHLVSEDVIGAARLVLDGPGEYEVGDVSVKGMQVRGHLDEEGQESATVFQFTYANSTVTVLGHIHPNVSDPLLEMAGGTDVLIIPVGGNGYTLDAVGAVSLIKKIEPDVVIPSQFDTEELNFEIPAAPIDDFIRISGLSANDPIDSYKLGKTDVLDGVAQTALVVLKVR